MKVEKFAEPTTKKERSMRKSRFSVEQIVYALKQAESGVPVAELCRKLAIRFAWRLVHSRRMRSDAPLRR